MIRESGLNMRFPRRCGESGLPAMTGGMSNPSTVLRTGVEQGTGNAEVMRREGAICIGGLLSKLSKSGKTVANHPASV